MNFTGQLFTPTPPTSYIGRFSVSPEQLPYISEHTTFLFAELDAHNCRSRPIKVTFTGEEDSPAPFHHGMPRSEKARSFPGRGSRSGIDHPEKNPSRESVLMREKTPQRFHVVSRRSARGAAAVSTRIQEYSFILYTCVKDRRRRKAALFTAVAHPNGKTSAHSALDAASIEAQNRSRLSEGIQSILDERIERLEIPDDKKDARRIEGKTEGPGDRHNDPFSR